MTDSILRFQGARMMLLDLKFLPVWVLQWKSGAVTCASLSSCSVGKMPSGLAIWLCVHKRTEIGWGALYHLSCISLKLCFAEIVLFLKLYSTPFALHGRRASIFVSQVNLITAMMHTKVLSVSLVFRHLSYLFDKRPCDDLPNRDGRFDHFLVVTHFVSFDQLQPDYHANGYQG